MWGRTYPQYNDDNCLESKLFLNLLKTPIFCLTTVAMLLTWLIIVKCESSVTPKHLASLTHSTVTLFNFTFKFVSDNLLHLCLGRLDLTPLSPIRLATSDLNCARSLASSVTFPVKYCMLLSGSDMKDPLSLGSGLLGTTIGYNWWSIMSWSIEFREGGSWWKEP